MPNWACHVNVKSGISQSNRETCGLEKSYRPNMWILGVSIMAMQITSEILGETGAKSNKGEMQQSQYLAQVMSLGIVIHNVVVQFDNPPFHPKMAGEMLSYRISSSKN